jgi:hypothetical protein
VGVKSNLSPSKKCLLQPSEVFGRDGGREVVYGGALTGQSTLINCSLLASWRGIKTALDGPAVKMPRLAAARAGYKLQGPQQLPWICSRQRSTDFSGRYCVYCQSYIPRFVRQSCLLFPYPALHRLEFFLRHSVAGCEISYGESLSQRGTKEAGSYWAIPALILASISTLESAGIHDSGSSTRSWIGILSYGPSAWPPSRSSNRVSCTHPCPTMASCFMLNGRDWSAQEVHVDTRV